MVSAAENDRLVWIDCEMTGLDLEVDELVEIAIVVTDFDLNVLDPGFQIVIKPDPSALANMNDFVTKMHETSGLLEEIPNGVSVAEAEFEALEYIQRFVPEGKAPLADVKANVKTALRTERYRERVQSKADKIDVSTLPWKRLYAYAATLVG